MFPLDTPCTAFEGHRCIASGPLASVALVAKRALDASAQLDRPLPVLVLQDSSSDVVELDWRGSEQVFAQRLHEQAGPAAREAPQTATEPATHHDTPSTEAARGPGRPRLGVVAREITLLPRHWEWLATQPGGASVALRKLVDNARREHEARDRLKQAPTPPTSSCPSSPAICRVSRKPAARCSPATRCAWTPTPAPGRPMCAQHLFELMAPVFSA